LVLIEDDTVHKEERRQWAAAALGLAAAPAKRCDGAPIHPAQKRCLSFAHCGPLTIGVSAAGPIGCDAECSAAFEGGVSSWDWVAEEVLRKLGNSGALRRDSAGRYSGDRGERIAILGEVATTESGRTVVGVGQAAVS
jgi:hypothetical protein